MRTVIVELSQHRLEFIAQVHSHPGTYADHSTGDSQGALMPFEGFVSVVVPNYGRSAIWPLCRCGVHRFEGGKFRRLSLDEVDQMFHVVPFLVDMRRR